jgi:cytochrome c oxidase subunit 2
VFFNAARPPEDSIQIYAVGKQWMWKLEHMEGRREINELHIPIGRPVRLTMTSEDVIHSFYVPAFRTKQDVVPGKYSTVWFNATKPGKYHLFCAEYCGTNHSGMIGWVYAMKPQDYEDWLSGGAVTRTMTQNGRKLFEDLACINCHKEDNTGRCPNLIGVFGTTVKLAGGNTVKADEAYIRESILQPQAKIVAGYEPVMPTFQGLVTEDQVLQLIEYVRSIGPKPAAAPSSPAAAEKQSPAGAAPAKR